MDSTKIRLSPEEEELITRADWILTKNDIIQKTKQMMAGLQVRQKAFTDSYANILPADIIHSTPKISKGENYKGLPWLVLDYPRNFTRKDNFAIRVLFWWGNFFSSTLHLSGYYKKMYEEKIVQSFESLKANDFFVCINEDPWEHHFEAGNYVATRELTSPQFKKMITEKDFLKLSKKIPLQQWNDAENKLLEIFRQLIQTLTV